MAKSSANPFKAFIKFIQQSDQREQNRNDNMNNWMRKESRRGETGPGAAPRKIGKINWAAGHEPPI